MIQIPLGVKEVDGLSEWVREPGIYKVKVKTAREGVTGGGDPKIDLLLVKADDPSVNVSYDTLSFSERGAEIAYTKARAFRPNLNPGDGLSAESLVGGVAWAKVAIDKTDDGKLRNSVVLGFGKCGYTVSPPEGAAVQSGPVRHPDGAGDFGEDVPF